MRTPSPKVIYFFIFATLIVTSVISYSTYNSKNAGPEKVAEEKVSDLAIVVGNEYKNTDSDSDGLLDWEETLWNTNPQKADSDNDGTKDGQEVALGRDPNKQGPDDAWVSNSYVDKYVASSNVDPNSLTSRIAKNMLIGVGQKNEDIAKDLLEQIKTEIAVTPSYKKENLITFDATDKVRLQKYATEFIKIYKTETTKVAVAQDSDPSVYSTAYKNMAVSLSVIEVPADLAGLHTQYINNLNTLSVFTSIITQAENDPVKMVAVLPEYDKIFQSHEVVLEQLKAYMKNNDIIFNIDA